MSVLVYGIVRGNGRAWQAFHVNWLFFTGLTFGSIAITSVHKIANAKWSGVILRLSQAASWFFPVSLVGLVLILTLGYHDIYGNMQEALGGVSPGKARWLSHSWMAARMVGGLVVLFVVGWALVRSDLLPDLALVKDRASREGDSELADSLIARAGPPQGLAARRQQRSLPGPCP